MTSKQQSNVDLSTKRRKLLDLMYQDGGVTATPSERIPQRTEGAILAQSFAQERLWFLHQLDPSSCAYNIPTSVRMIGRLDAEAVGRSFDEIIRRHESLRTVFESRDGVPVQVIKEPYSLGIKLTDLENGQGEPEEELERIAREEGQRGFDLSEGPLIRARLVKVSSREHVLIVVMHHIVSDGWSIGVLIGEMRELYGAYVEGREVKLKELEVQYADWAVWQRETLKGEELERQLDYWREQLKGAPEVMELAADRGRPAVQSNRGATERIKLSEELSEKLREMSRGEGVTLFMLMLAAFKVLLYRYSGQEEIVVGTPIANRRRREVEGLMGFFVNTLVMRTGMGGEPSFRELLNRVKEVALGAYGHQDLPFEKLVEELRPERDLSHTPLFQVMFVLQNAPASTLEMAGLDVTYGKTYNYTSKFDLLLEMFEMPGGFTGVFEYNTDLFEAETIRRMSGHFIELLKSITEDSGKKVSELKMLSDEEEEQLIWEWNGRECEYPDECIHELIEEQAKMTPEATAVVCGERLSYGELDERSNQLAHYLRGKGAGPEVLIGISVKRGIEMVVALLGVLKSGGAYVPLDPEYPRQRIEYMLEASGARIVVSDSEMSDRVKGGECTVVEVDRQAEEISGYSRERVESGVKNGNVAYVIYTSGSTGRPKGVAIEHHSTAAMIEWGRKYYGAEQMSVVLASTSICFDMSVFEIFATLSIGGRIVVVEEALAITARDQEGIKLIDTVPSAMAELVRMRRVPPSVEVVNLGGEALQRRLVEEIYELGHVKRVVNLYGPSEDTTFTTYWEAIRGEKVKIGRPITNGELYVLGRDMELVPVGVAGELYLGGEGVTRGYINDPSQTAEKFVPNQYRGEGERLYRTGDLVRYGGDGELEYLGRADHQVKVRGYRVELGEIEEVLRQHSAVEQCVVIVHDDKTDSKSIVAYIAHKQPADDPDLQSQVSGWQADHLSQWQTIFDETCGNEIEPEDVTFNIAGWNSSYTGLPIAEEEMREWTERTVQRILFLKPSRILELGCGNGLLLFRLASQCANYCGTDLSSNSLKYIERHLPDEMRKHTVLLHRAADNFEQFHSGEFDLVILNSVVQYFAGLDYLTSVIEKAVEVVRPGGSIFIGDVRNFALLEPFYASVIAGQASSSLQRSEFQQLLESHVAHEKELVIHPTFFRMLKDRLPRISDVEIHLKRGCFENEMTQFRYDVVLGVERVSCDSNPNKTELEWPKDAMTVDSVRRLLRQSEPEALCVRGVPNSRIAKQIRLVETLADREGPRTLNEILEAATSNLQTATVDPEEFWSLRNDLPYEIYITWSETGGPGSYDVILRRNDPESASASIGELFNSASASDMAAANISQYATSPLHERLASWLVPHLGSFLQERLPKYMVPSRFIVLDSMPLLPNGKIDRNCLPSPDKCSIATREQYVPPSTPFQEFLASIWRQVLGVERIGINDNFFMLGGHSLIATQVAYRVGEELQMEIPLRVYFEKQSIEDLASHIEQLVAADISNLTEEQVSQFLREDRVS